MFPIQSARMQLFVKFIRATVFLLALPLLLHAEPIAQLRPTDYVNDFAHVLDQGTVTQLDNVCQQIDQKAHAQIAVVTINSLDGSDIDSYAVELYKKWGIGSKATDHGVLILLAVQDRKYRIEVGYGLEPILPDGKSAALAAKLFPCSAEQLQRRGPIDDVEGGRCHRAGCWHHVIRSPARNCGATARAAEERPVPGGDDRSWHYFFTGSLCPSIAPDALLAPPIQQWRWRWWLW